MIADWVAASVRAKGMAQRRVGPGGCDRIASSQDLDTAVSALTDSIYGGRLAGVTTLSEAQRAVNETVLWQFRVLAGWMPASGTQLLAAAAAGFEVQNIVALAGRLSARTDTRVPYELGALATARPIVRSASSLADLLATIRVTRWGDVGTLSDADELSDILTAAWLHRVMAVAPAARPWVVTAFVLIAARILFVDHAEPSERFVQIVRPSLADTWRSTRDLTELAAALPRSARIAVEGIDTPADLWRAETRLVGTIEADGARLLRDSMPGPDVVLGAVALLVADAWRVRAALATSATEVKRRVDVMA